MRPTRDIDFLGLIENTSEAVRTAVLECLHVALDGLGWTLTADEQALMDTLDAYGRETLACVRATA